MRGTFPFKPKIASVKERRFGFAATEGTLLFMICAVVRGAGLGVGEGLEVGLEVVGGTGERDFGGVFDNGEDGELGALGERIRDYIAVSIVTRH
jgi:hypothetical protein